MISFRILKADIVDLILISFPLVGSMLAGLIMMLVDRICLSKYSEATLAASGPAIFNSMAIIMFFVGIAGITRVFVGQANGKKDNRHIAVYALSGIIVSVIIGTILILMHPIIMIIPDLSSRPEVIKALERDFMAIVPFYGFFMILNSCFGSIFNGVLKTRETMVVGVIGHILNATFTVLLVFGYMGFPELGMKGSAYGNLIATATNSTIYIVLLLKSGIFNSLLENKPDYAEINQIIRKVLHVGIPSGAATAIDEAGQAAFVWIVGGISLSGLMANNIGLAVNYLIIIPLMGLGIGTNVLIANKVGSGENAAILRVIKAAFCVAFIYVSFMTLLELLYTDHFLYPFISANADQEMVSVASDVIKVLFTYAIGFAFSMILGGALEAVGMTGHVLWTRVIVFWGISLPIIYFVASANSNNSYFVPICWLIASLFELIIGLIYGILFFYQGFKQKALIGM
jgi:multidrug resistance protein, MATE family